MCERIRPPGSSSKGEIEASVWSSPFKFLIQYFNVGESWGCPQSAVHAAWDHTTELCNASHAWKVAGFDSCIICKVASCSPDLPVQWLLSRHHGQCGAVEDSSGAHISGGHHFRGLLLDTCYSSHKRFSPIQLNLNSPLCSAWSKLAEHNIFPCLERRYKLVVVERCSAAQPRMLSLLEACADILRETDISSFDSSSLHHSFSSRPTSYKSMVVSSRHSPNSARPDCFDCTSLPAADDSQR